MISDRFNNVNAKLKKYAKLSSSQAEDKALKETADKFALYVNSIFVSIAKLKEINDYFDFQPDSFDSYAEYITLLDELKVAAEEQTVEYDVLSKAKTRGEELQKKLDNAWNTFYKNSIESVISRLDVVSSLLPEDLNVNQLKKRLQEGRAWTGLQAPSSVPNKSKPKLLYESVHEIEKEIEKLNLSSDISYFLKQVSQHRADIEDLTPEVLKWMEDKNLCSKFSINFKN